MNEPIQPELLKKALAQSVFSRNIVYHEILDSTNTLAKSLASQGAPEGTVVIAEEQTAGRGRRGRPWLSPGRTNLLVTILLRPGFGTDKVFSLTMVLALASLEAIQQKTGLSCLIKWPNDLYAERRKLAGILTEFAVRGATVEWVVLGLGLNVNWRPEGGKEIYLATSIFAETGVTISRTDLLVEILKRFEEYYRQVLSGESSELNRKWNASSLVMGKAVVIESDRERIEGRALRIDDCGALIVEDARGEERRILTGDVSLRLAPA